MPLNDPSRNVQSRIVAKTNNGDGPETDEYPHSKFIGDVKDYVKSERLGEGTYGVVFKGRHVATNEVVAIKKVKLDPDQMKIEGFPVTTLREISILKELRHPNIVALHQVLIKENNIFLVFEYVPMDLKRYLNSLKPKGERDFLSLDPVSHRQRMYRIFYQTVQAALFCHYRRIIHRDLKLQNILINDCGQVKLADFGLARPFEIPMKQYTQEIVTLGQRSPEILLGTDRYSCAVDVWSLGCIFAELMYGQPLLNGECEIGQLLKIFQAFGTPDVDTWPELRTMANFNLRFPKFPPMIDELIEPLRLDEAGEDCLRKMLVVNPRHRISSRALLEHHCFNGVDKSTLPARDP
ncbi:hypothetical protein ACOME3_002381 [Neoechinorhynchus agilis]